MARASNYYLAVGLASLLTIVAVVFAVIVLTIPSRYQATVFQPSHVMVADLASDQLEQTTLPLPTGETVAVYYHPVAQSPYVVLFFHGNYGNITTNTGNLEWLQQLGYSYVVVDYPGYGLSTGEPNEQNLYASADAVYHYVQDTLLVTPDQTVIIGQSLGGAVAIDLAARQPVHDVITVSTLASTRSVAQDRQLAKWVQWMIPQQFTSVDKISSIKAPILLIHGTADEVIPYDQSQQLLAGAAHAQLFTVSGAGHHDLVPIIGQENFVQLINTFITSGGLPK